MTTVYKYLVPMPLHDYFELELPAGVHVLTAGKQGDGLYLWARVDPANPTTTVRFRFVGTGHLIELDESRSFYAYVATVFDRPYVWHIFKVTLDQSGEAT